MSITPNPQAPCRLIRMLLGSLLIAASQAASGQDRLPPITFPVVTIVASEPRVLENSSVPASFTVGRTGDATRSLSVTYRIRGSAQDGVDYATLPGSITFPPGETRALIPVIPIPDAIPEFDESVELELVGPPTGTDPVAAYWIGFPGRAVVTIANAAPTTTNHPPSVALITPADGTRYVAPATITLAANAHDDDGTVTMVEFFAGTRRIGVANHVALEGSTNLRLVAPFHFVWADVPTGEYVLTARATDNAGATRTSPPVHIVIQEGIRLATVSVIASDPEASKAAEGPLPLDHLLRPALSPNTGRFTIRRDAATNESLTVFYELAGTASNGVDYIRLPGFINIPPGANSADVIVEPLPDSLTEGIESVELALTPPPFPTLTDQSTLSFRAPYLIGHPARATVTIADSQSPPPTNRPPDIRLLSPAPGTVLIAPANLLLTADARDTDGTVVAVEFYSGTNLLGTVTNNPLAMSPRLPVGPYAFAWTNVPRGEYILAARAIDDQGASRFSPPVNIRVTGENLQPMVVITATVPHAFEGPPPTANGLTGGPHRVPEPASAAVFTFRRTGGTNSPLTVQYSVGGSASNGVDYAALPGVVVIPAGQWRATVSVQPLDDDLVEGTESVVVTLEPPISIAIFPPPEGCYYLVGPNNRATAYIHDNDFVITNRPPVVRLVNPPDGAELAAGTPINLIADTRDSDGHVTSVEFFAGTNSLGIVTNRLFILAPVHPFSLVWSNAPAGTYTLTARATDDRGLSADSTPVRINILTNTPSPVVRVVAIDRYAVEQGTNHAAFRIFRHGATNDDLIVRYAVSGRASNGVDYAELPGVVTIPAGAHSADVAIIPIPDDLPEGVEDVTLWLLPAEPVASLAGGTRAYHGGPKLHATAFIFDQLPAPPRPAPITDAATRGEIPQPGWRLAPPRVDRTSDSITVNGDTDQMVVIEIANDLHEWTYLTHGIVMDGKLTFTDPDRNAAGTRFYRVVAP